MATAIRIIPTLHGDEARKFIENAEWTEKHILAQTSFLSITKL